MKNLIVYFSYSGNTKDLVEKVNENFKFDVVRLERKTPYSKDYNTCAYGEAKEEWEKKIHPKIKELGVNFNAYDRILLFFPIWWYTFPMPVATLIEILKNYGGEIVLFENSYTNDPKYVDNTLSDFKQIDSKLNVKQGLFNKSAKSILNLLKTW